VTLSGKAIPKRLGGVAAATALAAGVLVTAVGPANAAGSSAAVTCGNRPGGGFIYRAHTRDATPIRTGPYEACNTVRTAAGGAAIDVDCYLYNDYGNLWYKVEGNHFAYGGHFASSVKSHVSAC
jgi:hypothetical protein